MKFEFFHRVRNLGLSTTDRRKVESIELGVQATTTSGDPYSPLVEVQGLDGKRLACWPTIPDYSQLAEGAELQAGVVDLESAWTPWRQRERTRTLRRGIDFDEVVLGISLGALSGVCSELVNASRRWKKMVTRLKTVQTQALQIWLKDSTAALGWEHDQPLVSGYVKPLEIWADMSHVRDRESNPEVRSISYFCDVLEDAPTSSQDPGFPAEQRERVWQEARSFLETRFAQLLPHAAVPDSGTIRWDLLVDASGGSDEDRLRQQYWRANVNPSDRYVLSVKGSTKYRLRADDCDFDNLYVAGDWTDNGMNCGSAEAAAISGMQAARAILGGSELIHGESDLASPPHPLYLFLLRLLDWVRGLFQRG